MGTLRVLRFAAMHASALLSLMIAVLLASGCDRNMEPYVPGEKPSQPDLSKIFPAGAQQPVSPGIPEAPPGMGGRGAPPASSARPIAGVVSIAPELAAGAPGGGVLFIIARVGEAGPPTAVKRFASPSFPLEFSLGPADRMIQTVPFEGPFQLTARLDSDGNAMTREPGDLQGRIREAVAPGAAGLRLTLDELL